MEIVNHFKQRNAYLYAYPPVNVRSNSEKETVVCLCVTVYRPVYASYMQYID